MVRLRVAGHQIVNPCDINHCFQFFQIFVKKPGLRRLKQHHLIPGLHHIGIVGCAKLRIHHNIKHTQLVVNNTRPVEPVSQFNRFHDQHLSFTHMNYR